jgi:energy-coupling factor transporter ATP-binding protein EcfA2
MGEGHLATQSSGEAASVRAPVKFLRDSAAEEDFFGSHQRVANAINSVIDASDKHNVIGLLGAWGSGKSTVVKLLEGMLATSPTPTLVFTYDAWLHQSDPPRRAFLERFLAFLQSRALATEEKWQEAMDLLNQRLEESETRTTPTLTTAGYLTLFSLLLVPFGASLLDKDWLALTLKHHWTVLSAWVFPLGIALTLTPVLIAFLFYFAWRPVHHPFATDFFSPNNWTRHRPPHQDESLLAIIANKHVEKQKNRIVRSPDPTTIEFQKTFREMIVSAARDGHRLVIVVDNLDRLPDREAIEMWTTIRSFFLGAIPRTEPIDGGPPPAVTLPNIVLPIDNGALERIFAEQVDSTGKSFAESFMDKTFDVTFHVNPPILSDWHAYLGKLMREVFGVEIERQWASEIGRIFEKRISGSVTPRDHSVTPRDLNRMVNAIAALWLQWQDIGIPFLTVAYYAMLRGAFEKNPVSAIDSPIFDLSEHDPDWQQSLAALHFGVPPEDGLQILLAPKLRSAILGGDHRVFQAQVDIRGFERVLYGQIDTPDTITRGLDNLCAMLDRARIEEKPWAEFTWRKLRRAFLQRNLVGSAEEKSADTFKLLVTRVPVAELDRFLTDVGNQMSVPESAQIQVRQPTEHYRLLVSAWAEQVPKALSPTMFVMIRDAPIFLDVGSVGMLEGRRNQYIRTTVSGDDLARVFAQRLQPGATASRALEQAMLVMDSQPASEGVDVLVEAAKVYLTSQMADAPGTEAAVFLLGTLRRDYDIARSGLDELARSGQLMQRTVESFERASPAVSARLVALSILSGIDLPDPHEQGWESFVAGHPEFAIAVDANLTAYGDKAFARLLAELVRKNVRTQALASAIFDNRMRWGSLGTLDVPDIVGDVATYREIIPQRRLAEFLALAAGEPGFWDQLYSERFSPSAVEIFHILIDPTHSDGAARSRARSMLKSWLRNEIGTNGWEQEIRSGEPIVDLASRLQELDKRPLALAGDSAAALRATMSDITGAPGHAVMARWFRVAAMVKANERRAILRELRDRILAADYTGDRSPIITAGGKLLLDVGDFGARAEDSIRHVVLPQLWSEEGLNQLRKHARLVGDWVARAEQPLRYELAHALTADRDDGDEEARMRRFSLANEWGLKA